MFPIALMKILMPCEITRINLMTLSYDSFNSLRYLKGNLRFDDVIKAQSGINIINMVEMFAIVDSSNVG